MQLHVPCFEIAEGMRPVRRQNITPVQNDFSVEPELNQRPMDTFLVFQLIIESTVHRSTNWAIDGYDETKIFNVVICVGILLRVFTLWKCE